MLVFAITIHKSQELMLVKVVLNFDSKNFTFGLSYIALSWVWAIKYVIFEIDFSQDRFSVMPTPVVKKKIAKDMARKNTLYTSPVCLLSFPKVWLIIIINSFLADFALFDNLEGQNHDQSTWARQN